MPDDPQHEHGFMPEAQHMLTNHLRKLQNALRSNITAEMSQKSRGAFDVNPNLADINAQTIDLPVSMMVYPQDPFLSEPEIRELPPSEVQPGLVNTRIRIKDSKYAIAQPDPDNNYLYWVGTPEFNQVNAFYYATLTLRMFEKFAHRRIPWAFQSPRLNIDPHTGVGMNALYDEANRRLGFFTFTFEDEKFNTAQSADVVVHETAHAVLDGLRDLYNESFGLGPLAFHESFGDIAAVLVALQDDSLVWRLLDWTDGDLRVDNFVSMVAEHLVETIQNIETLQELNERTVYLRNALNKFKAVPFDDLPYFPNDPSHDLGRESHNYSRLFTGAFYDILVGIYEHIRHLADTNPRIAIHRARDIIGHLLVYAVEVGPVGELKFADMARAFLTADVILNDGRHTDIIGRVFADRLILSADDAEAHLATLRNLPDIRLPEYVDSALEAGIFLIETVIPALGLPANVDYTPMSAHRNQRGFAFLTYFTSRRIQLEGAGYGQFNGAAVDAFGGVTLAFAPDGKLVSALYRPVTDEDAHQIQVITAELIEHGQVMEQTLQGQERLLSDETLLMELPTVQPRLLYLEDRLVLGTTGDKAKLVRVPVILDAVPRRSESFLEYLQQWISR